LKINWLAFNYDINDGYGRYSRYMIKALNRIGVSVTPILTDQVRLSGWLQRLARIDYSLLTIACMPPYMLWPLPGRQWNLTMTEGTTLPPDWAPIANVRARRLIVPCEHNATAFEKSGVEIPIHVVPGGTEPAEFPMMNREYDDTRPYVFLALADRGARKGWVEVWSAFYEAFGTPDITPDVRLIVKTRTASSDLIDRIATGHNDPRITFWREDVSTMADVYAMAHCFAIPARSEGWGMPQREAAMMGLPVIVTKHSGLDDGHTDEWALVVDKMHEARIPAEFPHCRGYWWKADVHELAKMMRWCYDHRSEAAKRGRKAAQWLRENQTWEHAALALKAIIEEYTRWL
jgi:glycosyltransferase involved in cell wall biosynthesis